MRMLNVFGIAIQCTVTLHAKYIQNSDKRQFILEIVVLVISIFLRVPKANGDYFRTILTSVAFHMSTCILINLFTLGFFSPLNETSSLNFKAKF